MLPLLQVVERLLMGMVMLMLMMTGGAYGQTVCHAVSTDQVTTVACLFGQDVSRHDFNVQFFPTPDSDADIILVCNRRSTGGLLCKKGKGVDFDEDQLVITQLLLTSPPAKGHRTGQYLCQIVSSDHDHLRRCNVTYKDSPVTENLGITFTTNLVIIALFGLCFMALIITCLVCCIKREKIRDWLTELISERWRKAMDALECKRGFPLPDVYGMPQHFYNLGWRDALSPDNKTTDVKPSTAKVSEDRATQEKNSKNKDGGAYDVVEMQELLFKEPSSQGESEQPSPAAKNKESRARRLWRSMTGKGKETNTTAEKS